MSYCVRLSFLLLVTCAGTACAPTKPIQTSYSEPTPLPEPYMTDDGNISLLQLGRSISHNSVDIYDPWVTAFRVLPPGHAVMPKPDTIPLSRGVVVRDKSVRVYSLVTRSPAPEMPLLVPMPLIDPVPLKD